MDLSCGHSHCAITPYLITHALCDYISFLHLSSKSPVYQLSPAGQSSGFLKEKKSYLLLSSFSFSISEVAHYFVFFFFLGNGSIALLVYKAIQKRLVCLLKFHCNLSAISKEITVIMSSMSQLWHLPGWIHGRHKMGTKTTCGSNLNPLRTRF